MKSAHVLSEHPNVEVCLQPSDRVVAGVGGSAAASRLHLLDVAPTNLGAARHHAAAERLLDGDAIGGGDVFIFFKRAANS